MSALLDVSGVTLRYKTPSLMVTATDRVSFQVDTSDRFVLLGGALVIDVRHTADSSYTNALVHRWQACYNALNDACEYL